MARTAITTGLLALGDGGGALAPSAQADATNGNIVPFTTGSSYGAFGTILKVDNADSSPHTVIIRASGYTGAAAGARTRASPPRRTRCSPSPRWVTCRSW